MRKRGRVIVIEKERACLCKRQSKKENFGKESIDTERERACKRETNKVRASKRETHRERERERACK